MFSGAAIPQADITRPQNSQKETESLIVRGKQTKRTVQEDNRSPISNNDSSDRLTERFRSEAGQLPEDHRDWIGQPVSRFPERPTTTITSQTPDLPTAATISRRRPEHPAAATISDDRSHGSSFQRDAAAHLLKALMPHIIQQRQNLQASDTSVRAERVLLENDINPLSLNAEQFSTFQKQSDAVQNRTIETYKIKLAEQVCDSCVKFPATEVLTHYSHSAC